MLIDESATVTACISYICLSENGIEYEKLETKVKDLARSKVKAIR
jgi:hypothetical protein